MAELKPCPFCGGKAVLDHKYDRGIYQYSYVRCENYMCRIEGKAFAVQPSYSADDFAIEFWNRRAKDGN